MRKWLTLVATLLVLTPSWLYSYPHGGSPRVDISVGGGVGAVFFPGDSPDLWIIADRDCYVIVYEIDSEGYLRVLYPKSPYDNGFIRGNRPYRLSRPGSSRYYVSGPPGVVYLHVLASPRPFRRIYWDGCDGYAKLSIGVSWDNFDAYVGCVLPPRVYGDPYVAMQTIDEFICADMIEAGIVWADFVYFYVGHRVDYPRYLCYDCHGFGCPFDPYYDVCFRFTINIVNPRPVCSSWCWWWWCTPKRVYCGPRYVCIERQSHYWDKRDRPQVYKWKSKMEPVHSFDRSIEGEMVRLEGRSTERELSKGWGRESVEMGRTMHLYTREEARERRAQAQRVSSTRQQSQEVSNRARSGASSIVERVVRQLSQTKSQEASSGATIRDHGSGLSSSNQSVIRRDSNGNSNRNKVAPSVRTRSQRESQKKRR